MDIDEKNNLCIDNDKSLNQNIISMEDSLRITSLRFLLMIFIVFIHNNLKVDEAINYYHLAFEEPFIITCFKYIICNLFGNAAVPLFFLFAGYLQFSKNYSYPTLLYKKTKALLLPYILWTFINISIFFIAQSIPSLSPFFSNEANLVRNWKFIDWLGLFWTHTEIYPFVYQFWFLRNLLVLIFLSPILRFIAKKYPFSFFIIIFLCYINNLPLGFGKSLFYYMAGFYFAEYKFSFFSISDKIKYSEYAILLILSFVLIQFFPKSIITCGFETIISCFFFLKLSGSIIKIQKLYKLSEYLAGFSFFLYAIHTPSLGTTLNKISWRIIPLHGIGCLIQFVIPCLLTIIIGTGIGIFLKRICPSLFGILNGGR